jgi:hypothetical protein
MDGVFGTHRVADITYVELAGGGFCYAAFVTDVVGRFWTR